MAGNFKFALTLDVRLGQSFKRTFGTARREQARLGAGIRSFRGQSKQGAEATDRMGRQLARTSRQTGEHGRRLGETTRKYKTFGRSVKESERQLGRLQKRQRQLGSQTRQSPLGGLGAPLGVAGAAYAASRLFRSSLDREGAEVRLRTVLDPSTVERDLELARQHAREFARTNLTGDVEMIQIQYALNSAGLGAEAARAGSEIVAALATVTSGAPELVGEVVATTFNNLGDSLEGSVQDRLGRIGDLLAKTQLKFQIRDFGQLGESMKTAAPALKANNVALAQGVTLIGALNTAGVQGSESGTALQATFRGLSKASAELGFNIVRTEAGNLDFIATLGAMRSAIGGFDNTDQRQIDQLREIFGDEGVRAVSLLGPQVDRLTADEREVAESADVVLDSYRHFLDSTGGKTKIFGNQVKLLGESFAGALLPALGATVPILTAAAYGFEWMMTTVPLLPEALGAAAVAAGGLFVFGRARTAVTGLAEGFPFLGKAAKRLGKPLVGLATRVLPLVATGIRAVGAAALANPIGLAIAAAVVAALLIYKYWEPIGKFFAWLWEGIKTVTSIAWSGIKAYVLEFTPLGALIRNWEPIKGWFSGLWEGVKTMTSAAWTYIKDLFFNFHPVGLLIANWGPVKGYFKGLWDTVKEWFSGLSLADAAVKIVGTLVEGIKSSGGAVWSALKGVLGTAGRLLPSSDAREGPLSRLTASGRSILGTLGQGVRHAGPGGLVQPLGRALATAAAATALALPVVIEPPSLTVRPGPDEPGPDGSAGGPAGSFDPRPPDAGGQVVNYYYYTTTIHQQPGEDPEALAERVIRTIERKQQTGRRAAAHDIG